MTANPTSTFLELLVGSFRLALRTHYVVGVQSDCAVAPTLDFRGETVPCADLGKLCGAAPRPRVAYGLVIEARVGWVAIGVDRVEHVASGNLPVMIQLPRFGLSLPHLFEGALRLANRLLVVADAEALAAYVAQSVADDFA